jgi:putative ABC transport system permease protein
MTPAATQTAANRARAHAAGSTRVAWRRSASDRGLLLTGLLLTVATAFLALTGPRLLVAAADDGVRAAVREAGSRADLVANLSGTSTPDSTPRDPQAAAAIRDGALTVRAGMPPEIRSLVGSARVSRTSTSLRVISHGTVAAGRLAWVWSETTTGVRWVAGQAPGASAQPADATAPRLVEVGLTHADADAIGAAVGDHLDVYGPTSGAVQLVVRGVFEPVDAGDPVWSTVPGLLSPARTSTVPVTPAIGLLLSADSVPDVALALQPKALLTTYTFPVDPGSLTAAGGERVAAATSALMANPTPLAVDGATPVVATGLDAVLRDYAGQLRGVTAQASMLLVAVVVVGALVLLLSARLLVGRREALLAAERARGASVASVAIRLALEQVPLAVAGVAVGALGARLATPDGAWTWWPAMVVGLVAILAVPLAGARVAARSWTGRQLPANRRDRDRLVGRRRARRSVVELTVVALAVGATIAIRGRGLLQGQTDGIDLLLAAAPSLLAAAATIVILRVFPHILRFATRLAAGRPGVVGLLAGARATRTAGIGLPLLSLTIALGLVVFSGITAASLQHGQERAAAEAVGADVQVDGPIPSSAVQDLRARPGVTAVSAGELLAERTFDIGSGVQVTLLGLDAAQYDLIAARHEDRYRGEVAQLATPSAAPRAVVSPALLPEIATSGSTVMYAGNPVALDVVGTTDLGAPGELLVIVDRSAFNRAGPQELVPDRLWVDGPGAAAAVQQVIASDAWPRVTVTDRVQWLEHARSLPLVKGLLGLLAAAALVLAAYAAVALALTVVATSPERGRTLSTLRTLGLDGRAAWAITLGEMTPLAVAGAVAGAAIGLGVPLLLTSALGLDSITGELRTTPVVLTAGPFLLAIGASLVALALSVVIEAAVRRRDQLAEVLRSGER